MQPTLDQFLTDRLDEIAAEIAGEIAERVPTYTHLRPREILALVRAALAAYTGARETGAVLDAFRDLGASEARASHDVRHFESALRTGARVLIRRTACAAARLYPPTAEYISVMERAFSAECRIVQAAVEGHHRAGRREAARLLRPLFSEN